MMAKHPSWEDILAHLSDDAGSGATADHLRDCSSCTSQAAEIRRLLENLRVAAGQGPSPELVERTWRRISGDEMPEVEASIIDQIARVARSLGEGLRELGARLVTDSLTPAMAVRGTGVASPRMLVYETDGYAISVAVSPGSDPELRAVQGQLVPKSSTSIPPGGVARLQCGTQGWEVSLSEFGEFQFDDVSPGALEISVTVGDAVIRMSLAAES
jgi:hypothetical protein